MRMTIFMGGDISKLRCAVSLRELSILSVSLARCYSYIVSSGGGNGRRRGYPPSAALCRGRHLEGQKYGILKFYTPNLAYTVPFTVYTNAIVVTIRISFGDLIAGVEGLGAATKTFSPGGKHPRAATGRLTLFTELCNTHVPSRILR